ncbi:MAG: hypothetical protein EON58_10695 [Alphaproteobacteria bacterium]|nr:MAG: hypothetical protein EON58_10695 [Alphaproteobacteria bacterium]
MKTDKRLETRADLGFDIPSTLDFELEGAFLTTEQSQQTAPNLDGTGNADWSIALELVRSAAAALSERENQVEQMASKAALQADISRDELRSLQAQLLLAQGEISRAYEDAARANKRATEAEAWLSKLVSATHGGFGHLAADTRLSKL